MLQNEFAIKEAERLIRSCGIDCLPVDVEQITADHEILLQPMPPSSDGGVSGMIIRTGNNFGILYATHIGIGGFQRFSIAHELGHYFLPGHVDAVSRNGIHESHCHFHSENRFEREADQFASGLLMPHFLFGPAMDRYECGLDAISEMAELCATSLSSTAIQYVKRSPEVVAMVMSQGDKILYSFLSESLREYPVKHPKKGVLLPPASLTLSFNKIANNVQNGETCSGISEVQDWFGSSVKGELFEEVVGLGRYGRTLTILTADDLPSLDEIRELEELEESWAVGFRK